MKEQTRPEPKILAAAERQMQAWVMTQEMEDRAIRTKCMQRLADSVEAYVTISREKGAGGGQIAEAVGKRLGWQVLDKNLLDHIAERFHVSRPLLELVDETRSNWLHDVLATWMDRKVIPAEKYVAHLCHVIMAAARQANLVLVGRGAQFLLPRDKGLAVRMIAPEKYRVEQIMRTEGLSRAEARRWMEDVDHGRREFVRRYFHRDIDDPHLYDLVINVEQLGPSGATEQILAAVAGRR